MPANSVRTVSFHYLKYFFMVSYWEKKQFFFHRDLIICGAGFTGLWTAVFYKKKYPGRKVLILEKDVINGGASTKNAGFACFGSASELLADLHISGEAETFSLVEKRWRGLQNLRSTLGDQTIGYEHKHGFEIFRRPDPLYDKCMNKLDYLNKMIKSASGNNVFKTSDEKIALFGLNGIGHIIENTGEGQVDTGRMYASMLQLAKETGVEIFNGIRVNDYEEKHIVEVNTTHGTLTSNQFLIANNGFASQILRNSQTNATRAQVLITNPVEGLKISGAFHMHEGFYYFRDVDGRVLLGGGRNTDYETEATDELQLNDGIQQHLEDLLSGIILPNQKFVVAQRWTGIMGMGKKKQVIVKQLSDKTYCAIRLSGMGLALSTLLGKEVAEMMA